MFDVLVITFFLLKISGYFKSDEIKPMTMQQYEQRIDKAFDEFNPNYSLEAS